MNIDVVKNGEWYEATVDILPGEKCVGATAADAKTSMVWYVAKIIEAQLATWLTEDATENDVIEKIKFWYRNYLKSLTKYDVETFIFFASDTFKLLKDRNITNIELAPDIEGGIRFSFSYKQTSCDIILDGQTLQTKCTGIKYGNKYDAFVELNEVITIENTDNKLACEEFFNRV